MPTVTVFFLPVASRQATFTSRSHVGHLDAVLAVELLDEALKQLLLGAVDLELPRQLAHKRVLRDGLRVFVLPVALLTRLQHRHVVVRFFVVLALAHARRHTVFALYGHRRVRSPDSKAPGPARPARRGRRQLRRLRGHPALRAFGERACVTSAGPRLARSGHRVHARPRPTCRSVRIGWGR
jgi:hypothetical protein